MIQHRRIFITFLFILLSAGAMIAQCPMCKIAAESNLENGGTAGKGLNTGILYMLSMPYLLVGVLGYLWYRNKKGHNHIQEEEMITPSISQN